MSVSTPVTGVTPRPDGLSSTPSPGEGVSRPVAPVGTTITVVAVSPRPQDVRLPPPVAGPVARREPVSVTVVRLATVVTEGGAQGVGVGLSLARPQPTRSVTVTVIVPVTGAGVGFRSHGVTAVTPVPAVTSGPRVGPPAETTLIVVSMFPDVGRVEGGSRVRTEERGTKGEERGKRKKRQGNDERREGEETSLWSWQEEKR